MIARSWSRRAAETLEDARFSGVLARSGAALWQRFATARRPLRVPANLRVVGVGGAVLGGSGKTPLALSVARALSKAGAPVAVVASPYPARVASARVVSADDDFRRVGDEALLLARALQSTSVPVFVGPSRSAALALAADVASVVVIDGLLQATPNPVTLSLLALDGARPWGAGRCPPAGDLRAARHELLQACDALVQMDGAPTEPALRPCYAAARRLLGARLDSGEVLPPEQLTGLRVGVCLGVARPERVLDMLLAAGIRPEAVWLDADHRAPRPPRALAAVDLWLTTSKCAVKLPATLTGRAVAVLDVEWVLEKSLISLVISRCGADRGAPFSRVSSAPTTC
ncbi:MAG TPA: tetraacyldisaccharide 4'-kinase [Polyangiaceae bacterium]|nr:tetraacyldisaccharide 4'-kinase [Polyangiaceae bacterium]